VTLEVRRATDQDVPALAATLASAFTHDPPMAWIFRDPTTRPDRLRSLFTLAVLGVFLPNGEIYVTPDVGAASLWERRDPDRAAATAGEDDEGDDDFPDAMAASGFLPDEIDRMLTFLGMTNDAHPHEPAHWYLGILGVDLARQGQGLGSACVAPKLAVCDANASPAYLESSNERNVPLYERLGFRVTGVFDLPDGGPPLWQMWREPVGR
jgi:ribosomal protein S18 acetylase RimI-like enzyme